MALEETHVGVTKLALKEMEVDWVWLSKTQLGICGH